MQEHGELANELRISANGGKLEQDMSDLHPVASVGDLVQYVLNTAEERRVIDSAVDALKRAGAEIGAFEHDGLYVQAPRSSAER